MDLNQQHQVRRSKRVSRAPDLPTISELCIEFHSRPNIEASIVQKLPRLGGIQLPLGRGLSSKLERLGHTHLLRVAPTSETSPSLVTGNSNDGKKLERLGRTSLPRAATTTESSPSSVTGSTIEKRKLERMGRTQSLELQSCPQLQRSVLGC